MYSIKIRDHVMIAHSLKGDVFGPAQKMHGATYVIDVIFKSKELTKDNIVFDIGLAHEVLKSVLQPLNYQNLDELPQFAGKVTTTEFLAKYVHDKIHEMVAAQFAGTLEVVLGESHVAWASYSAE
jgi:6-pyruvoyltetrahydropterin/6-carboxytetrahydropterin synthase